MKKFDPKIAYPPPARPLCIYEQPLIAIIHIIIVIHEEQVCLGPVGDQSKGKRVVTGFIQGFGISGEWAAAEFVLVIIIVKIQKHKKREGKRVELVSNRALVSWVI